LSNAYVTDEIDDDTGPFDYVDEGEEYISIYAGN
jgi:hypothetical protein